MAGNYRRMPSFAESFASRFGGTSAGAEQRLFWRCLYLRSLPFIPLLLLLKPTFFQPDRELLKHAARAASLQEIGEEINEYRSNPANLGWLRQHANFRISTRRLHRIARECLASPDSVPGRKTTGLFQR